MTKKFCDICGKELKDCKSPRYKVKQHFLFDVWVDVDICWDCFKALRDKHIEPVRHGHWIKISPAGIYECSECGKNVMTNDIEAYEYCHGCGAIMDGENNE